MLAHRLGGDGGTRRGGDGCGVQAVILCVLADVPLSWTFF